MAPSVRNPDLFGKLLKRTRIRNKWVYPGDELAWINPNKQFFEVFIVDEIRKDEYDGIYIWTYSCGYPAKFCYPDIDSALAKFRKELKK